MNKRLVLMVFLGIPALAAGRLCFAQTSEWAGIFSIEPRLFLESPAFPEQSDKGLSPSAVLAPEYRYAWNGGDDRITLAPFYRYDSDDDERDHADLREANWQHFDGPWTTLVGFGKVFWGVTESRHLVDIINQTDLVEDLDEEQKLGQPMINIERWSESGTLGLYVLPGFRERTFPANDARLRGPVPIAHDDAVYESGAEDRRVDVALRWFNTLGDWDVGLYGFYGTGREPRLVPKLEASGDLVLVPYYDIISQFGIDAQYTRNAWLWKLEALVRSGQGSTFAAAVAGFEYTFYGVSGSNVDFGLLAEYLYDGRDAYFNDGRWAEAPYTPLEDDIFVGFRATFNDPDDTNILAGVIVDRVNGDMFASIEAERRFGERWKLEAELRWFSNIDDDSFLVGFSRDSYVTLRAAWYF